MKTRTLLVPDSTIIWVPGWIWSEMCLDPGKKKCVSIGFVLDYFGLWVELCGHKDWRKVFLQANNLGGRKAIESLLKQIDRTANESRSLININHVLLEPVNQLLQDFKQAEAERNRRKMYQLAQAWRDMKLKPLSDPKGRIDRSKFYRYKRETRESIRALITVVHFRGSGRDVKNLLIAAIWIE